MRVLKTVENAVPIFIILFFAGSPFSIAITQSALFLAVAGWLLLAAFRKTSVPKTSLEPVLIAYVLAGLLSLAVNRQEAMIVVFTKRILLIPAVYLLVSQVRTGKFLRTLLATWILVMSVLSVIGIVKYLSGTGGLDGRLRLYHHYMTSGGILMIIGLVTLAFAVSRTPPKVRIAALGLGGLMLAPLIFTFTRSSWMGWLAGLLVMAVLRNRKILLFVPVAVLLFILAAPQSVRDRAKSVLDPWHPNNIERTYMWKAGIEIVKDHPLAGVGDRDLGEVYERYRPPESRQKHGHLHNNFIMFGATLGIPGWIVFLALFLKIGIVEIRMFRSIPEDRWLPRAASLGCLGAYAGFHVNGLFEWNFGDAEIALLLWMTVGLAIACGRIGRGGENIPGGENTPGGENIPGVEMMPGGEQSPGGKKTPGCEKMNGDTKSTGGKSVRDPNGESAS